MAWNETARAQYTRIHSGAHTRYETDVTNQEWTLIEGLLPPPSKMGRPREMGQRAVFKCDAVSAWHGLAVVRVAVGFSAVYDGAELFLRVARRAAAVSPPASGSSTLR